jgi:hypothetical protein
MPRFDTLTSIHKAIRAMVYERGGALQTTDFADRQEAARAAADLEAVLFLLHDHHTTEEKFVFPKLRPFEEQLVDEMLAQHQEVVRLLGITEEARVLVTTEDAGDRAAAGGDLNRRFNETVAFYFDHLAREEAEVLPATWRHFDDGELMAIQGAIVSAAEPGVTFQWLGWMFKGLSRPELVGLLAGARMAMPPEALEAVRRLGAASLEPAAWEAVREQSGL